MKPTAARPGKASSGRLASLLGSIAAFLALSTATEAATIVSTWSSATSGIWNVPANWTNVPAQVAFPNNGTPVGSTYDAIIAATGPAYTVTLNTNVAVEDLTLDSANATLNHAIGTISVTNAITISSGTYRLNSGGIQGGTVTGSGGTFSVLGVGSRLDGVNLGRDASVENGATLDVLNGLVLSDNAKITLGAALSSSTLNFRSGAQTLGGTGEIVFGGSSFSSSNYLGANSGSTVPMPGAMLTIGPGVTVRGTRSGTIFALESADSVLNQGTVLADTANQTITLSGNWGNAGTLRARNGGSIHLGSTFTTSDLGTFDSNGGVIAVTGTLDNTGATLALTPATGSLTLLGGTLRGGTVTGSGGVGLLVPSYISSFTETLDGVNLGADATVGDTAVLNVTNGLALENNAKVTLNSVLNSSWLRFRSGVQTLGGSGEIVFGGGLAANILEAAGGGTVATAATLTIGPGVTVRGTQGGSIEARGSNDSILNQGTILAEAASRTITLRRNFTNAGTVAAINGGSVTAQDGYIQTAGTTRVADNSTLTITSPSVLDLKGGVLEGNGTVAGKVISAATIAPGLSAGTLNITNDLTLTGSSIIAIELGGTVQGTQYDLLTETGTVALNLDGTLSLTLINSFVPAAADVFTVVDSNQPLAGAFKNVANGGRLGTKDGLGSFQVNYGATSAFPTDRVVLSNFLPVPEPGSAVLLGLGAGLLGWRRR